VPYEKGYNFLFFLEHLLGGPIVFNGYLKSMFFNRLTDLLNLDFNIFKHELIDHVKTFSHKSITTNDFKLNLYKYIEKHHTEKLPLLNSVDWDAWFHKPGNPPVENEFDRTLARSCEELASRWRKASLSPINNTAFSKDDIKNFTSTQVVVFLELFLGVGNGLTVEALDIMEKVYEFSAMKNSEIKARW
jgi:hypothetical protein